MWNVKAWRKLSDYTLSIRWEHSRMLGELGLFAKPSLPKHLHQIRWEQSPKATCDGEEYPQLHSTHTPPNSCHWVINHSRQATICIILDYKRTSTLAIYCRAQWIIIYELWCCRNIAEKLLQIVFPSLCCPKCVKWLSYNLIFSWYFI